MPTPTSRNPDGDGLREIANYPEIAQKIPAEKSLVIAMP